MNFRHWKPFSSLFSYFVFSLLCVKSRWTSRATLAASHELERNDLGGMNWIQRRLSSVMGPRSVFGGIHSNFIAWVTTSLIDFLCLLTFCLAALRRTTNQLISWLFISFLERTILACFTFKASPFSCADDCRRICSIEEAEIRSVADEISRMWSSLASGAKKRSQFYWAHNTSHEGQ